MSLPNKHRPTTLDEVKGNDETVSLLDDMLNDLETCPHVFLFTGPKGCGKTTIARIIGTRLGIKGLDLREIDAGILRGIDTVRDIRSKAAYLPLEGDRRGWIIDECHKLTNDAQNAFLKILEEPPPHVYFIFCTTEPEKLIGTFKDRCTKFQVNPLNENQMMGLLRRIAKEEGEKLDKEVIEQIFEDSLGHPRNAIQILDKVLRVKPEMRLEMAKEAAELQSEIIELCRVLMSDKPWKAAALILTGLKTQEPETVRRSLMWYCTAVVLKGKKNNQAALIMDEMNEPFYNSGFPGLVLACYRVKS